MHNRVCVPVAHFKIVLQMCHLLHVSQLGNLLQLFHPMRDWFAVFLLDGRKIRGGSSYLLLIHPNMVNDDWSREVRLPSTQQGAEPLDRKPTIHL